MVFIYIFYLKNVVIDFKIDCREVIKIFQKGLYKVFDLVKNPLIDTVNIVLINENIIGVVISKENFYFD